LIARARAGERASARDDVDTLWESGSILAAALDDAAVGGRARVAAAAAAAAKCFPIKPAENAAGPLRMTVTFTTS
jgi:hypothetical protein